MRFSAAVFFAPITAILFSAPSAAFPCTSEGCGAGDSSLLSHFHHERAILLHEAAPEISPLAGEVGFSFPVTEKVLEHNPGFALGVRGEFSHSLLRLSIDGRPFDAEPLQLREELWWQIPPGLFVPGEATVALSWAEGERVSFEEVILFRLEDGAEEAHFARFLMAGEQTKAQPPTHPTQDKMEMRHIDLTMTLTPDSRTIPSAVAVITARAREDGLDQFVFDFDTNNGNFPVTSITNSITAEPLPWTSNGERLFIDLPAPLNEGQDFHVAIAYGGTPRLPSTPSFLVAGFRRTTHNGVPVLYTGSQTYYARTWFPCIDVPEHKFTIDFHITVPRVDYSGWPFSVVANGQLLNVVETETTRTYHWSHGHPVVSYLVHIAATNYRPATAIYTSLDGETEMEVTHYLYPESYAAESGEAPTTVEILEYFAETFGEYPFLDEKYATATWGINYGMEHQTITSMPNLQHQTRYTRRAIHEIAHSWFGNMVTMVHYDHIWLNEGWATYCEALFYEYQETQANGAEAGRQRYHNYVNAWSTSDAYPIVSSSADNFAGSIVYRKGAWVLHMLRRVLGDEDFFQGARNYLEDPELRFKTAHTSDLQRHFEEVSGIDLERFFDQWLYRAARPNYEWEWGTRQQGGNTLLDVVIHQTQAGQPFWMPIDLHVTYGDSSTEIHTVENGENLQFYTINVGQRSVAGVQFDPDNWILANKSQITSTVPEPPRLISVIGDSSAGAAHLRWQPSPSAAVIGYRVYQIEEDGSEILLADVEDLGPSDTEYTVLLDDPLADAYFAVSAVRTQESVRSMTYGVRLAAHGGAGILVIDGFNRQLRETGQTHDYAEYHGRALAANGVAFDTCWNHALQGDVALGDYTLAVWFLANESTADETFSMAEQALVRGFLEAGGRLFVSGNEIAWDLDLQGSPADRAFFNDYLRAAYVEDDSGIYTVIGSGPPFEDATYEYGEGAYFPNWPDAIAPVGSDPVIEYVDSDYIAAVRYHGPFGSSSVPGRLIYLGFGFETINTAEERNDFMHRVLMDLLSDEFSGLEGLLLW